MDKIRGIFCVLFGHSNIEDNCMGYHSCARCGVQLGDSLGGAYKNSALVGLNHDCPVCEANYKKLSWRDKFLTPTPLVAKSQKERDEAKSKHDEARDALRKFREARVVDYR